MQNAVKRIIIENNLIVRGETVMVALSGGADSTALLCCLNELKDELGFELCAAHLNHGIRGEEADDDQRFCQALCDKLGIELVCRRLSIPERAKISKRSIETEARIARYEFLEQAKLQTHADKTAVAHHMEDQAESILLHIFRGSALNGISGMKLVRGDIIRPLLSLRKSSILDYLNERGQDYCTDSTNLDRTSTRNRLRLDVIPYISQYVNSNIVESLCSTAQLAAEDESLLQDFAAQLVEDARGDGYYDRTVLAGAEMPIKSRAVRLILNEQGIYQDIERSHISALCKLISADTGSSAVLPGIQAYVSYERLYLGSQKKVEEYEQPLVLPGLTITPAGKYRTMIVDGTVPFSENRMVGCLDHSKLPAELTVRSRKDGDRFYPVGAPGSRKLKEVFIDRKVPRFERDIPVLASGSDILFVPGIGVAESVKVDDDTHYSVWIAYEG